MKKRTVGIIRTSYDVTWTTAPWAPDNASVLVVMLIPTFSESIGFTASSWTVKSNDE